MKKGILFLPHPSLKFPLFLFSHPFASLHASRLLFNHEDIYNPRQNLLASFPLFIPSLFPFPLSIPAHLQLIPYHLPLNLPYSFPLHLPHPIFSSSSSSPPPPPILYSSPRPTLILATNTSLTKTSPCVLDTPMLLCGIPPPPPASPRCISTAQSPGRGGESRGRCRTV